MNISDLSNKDQFRIVRVTLGKEVGKRLADMGFTRGVEGRVVRCALFGDPLQVTILGYNVSIRKSEADGVEIEKTGSGAVRGKKRT